MPTDRTPLFSVPKSAFTFEATKGSGPGGQHRNKTSTAIRVTHPPSGAVGYSQEQRSQLQNKQAAWKRCVDTTEFQRWLHIEVSRVQGQEAFIEAAVEKSMQPKNLLVEVGGPDGWVRQEMPQAGEVD